MTFKEKNITGEEPIIRIEKDGICDFMNYRFNMEWLEFYTPDSKVVVRCSLEDLQKILSERKL